MRLRQVLSAALLVIMLPSIVAAAPEPAPSRPTKNRKKAPAPSTDKAAPKKRGPAVAEAPPVKATVALVHEVQRGETLSTIAKKYNVTLSSVVIANTLRGPRARVIPGQRLTIPQRPGSRATVLRGRRGPIDEPLPVSLVLGLPDFEEAPAFRWPVEGPVTSTFGRRRRSWHRGLDIRADPGTPIVASAPGVVITSGFEPRYGQRVKIQHEGGFVTVYAHNQDNLVEEGQEVAAGQVIGTVGRTGRATGEHVHFEIRYDGRVYNPLYLLPLPPRTVQFDLTAGDEITDDE